MVLPDDKGAIHISEEVVAAIAAVAISEVDGVFGLASSLSSDIREILGRKNISKGIKLSIVDGVVTIECYVVVLLGYAIPVIAASIQDCVINAVESMTGLTVNAVNIEICGISSQKN